VGGWSRETETILLQLFLSIRVCSQAVCSTKISHEQGSHPLISQRLYKMFRLVTIHDPF